MDEHKRSIDEIFREGLDTFREAPPPAAWEAVTQRLDAGKAAFTNNSREVYRRWPWIMLALLLFIGSAWFFATLYGHGQQSNKPVAFRTETPARSASSLARTSTNTGLPEAPASTAAPTSSQEAHQAKAGKAESLQSSSAAKAHQHKIKNHNKKSTYPATAAQTGKSHSRTSALPDTSAVSAPLIANATPGLTSKGAQMSKSGNHRRKAAHRVYLTGPKALPEAYNSKPRNTTIPVAATPTASTDIKRPQETVIAEKTASSMQEPAKSNSVADAKSNPVTDVKIQATAQHSTALQSKLKQTATAPKKKVAHIAAGKGDTSRSVKDIQKGGLARTSHDSLSVRKSAPEVLATNAGMKSRPAATRHKKAKAAAALALNRPRPSKSVVQARSMTTITDSARPARNKHAAGKSMIAKASAQKAAAVPGTASAKPKPKSKKDTARRNASSKSVAMNATSKPRLRSASAIQPPVASATKPVVEAAPTVPKLVAKAASTAPTVPAKGASAGKTAGDTASGKTSGSMPPVPPADSPLVQRKKIPLSLSLAAMAGYEWNFNSPIRYGFSGSLRLLWHFDKKWAVGLQPAFRYSGLRETMLSEEQAYQQTKVTVTSFTSPTPSPSILGRIDTLYNYVVHETFDSIVVQGAHASGSIWSIEIPLLLDYRLNKDWHIYGGPSISIGGKLSIIPGSMQTYTTTHRDSIAQSQERSEESFAHYFGPPSALPQYSTAASGTDGDPANLRLGYLLGLGYERRRFMVDASVHGQVSGYSAVVPALQPVYRGPALRLSIGYYLFRPKATAKAIEAGSAGAVNLSAPH